jgi:hypothetical protein
VTPGRVKETTSAEFEEAVRANLAVELQSLRPSWAVTYGPISAFEQYRHLERLDRLVRRNEFLRAEIGRDYLIEGDVIVSFAPPGLPQLPPAVQQDIATRWRGVPPPVLEGMRPVLHAAISLKWTIRSDRVQNIRHEGVILTRVRRGRQPHVSVVTLEPLPTRLASIARGTGEVDAVYHVLFEELWDATHAVGNDEQKATLEELVDQGRLRPWDWLSPTIAGM